MLNTYHSNSAIEGCRVKKAFLKPILQKNIEWSMNVQELRKDFFVKSAQSQSPAILWIGCSDSRVPPEVIVQCNPGDMFVHRNIGNMCPNEDLNSMSVIQYAVEVLKVEHIVVCGHYGCGGVRAAVHKHSYGLIDSWLDNIQKVISDNSEHLEGIKDPQLHEDLVVELNVAKSISNIVQSDFVQKAWQNHQLLSIHGLCYDLEDGVLHDLDMDFDNHSQIMTANHTKHLLVGKTGEHQPEVTR